MVGDWPERDMAGAKSIGMKTVFARYGDVFDTKRNTAKKNEARKVKNLLFIHLIIHYSAYFFDSFYI